MDITLKITSIREKINLLKLKCVVFKKMKREAVNAEKTLAEDRQGKGLKLKMAKTQQLEQ